MNELLKWIDGLFDVLKKPVILTGLLIHGIYILMFFGIVVINTKYVSYLSIFIQLFVCVFLMIRFNPFREYAIQKIDKIIIFNSATFLLMNLGITEPIRAYIEQQSFREKLFNNAKNINIFNQLLNNGKNS